MDLFQQVIRKPQVWSMDLFQEVVMKPQVCSRDRHWQSSMNLPQQFTMEVNQDQSLMDLYGPIMDQSLMKLTEKRHQDSIREAPQECSMQLHQKSSMMLHHQSSLDPNME